MSMTTANKYELHAQFVTMVADSSIAYDSTAERGSAHVGKVVMLTAEDTVGLVTDAKEIFGRLMSVEPDGFCTVQDEGYCDVGLDGAATYTEAGNGMVGGTTAGTVKKATAVPAAASIRTARAIKGDGSGRVIIKL